MPSTVKSEITLKGGISRLRDTKSSIINLIFRTLEEERGIKYYEPSCSFVIYYSALNFLRNMTLKKLYLG